MNMREIKIKKK